MALSPMELWSTTMEWLLPRHPSPWKIHQSDPDQLIHLQGHPTSRETETVFWSMRRKSTGLFLLVLLTTSLPSWGGGTCGWRASKMFSHSALHPFYLKSLNQSVTDRIFFLPETMLAAEETRHPHVRMWTESFLPQSWCCALKFPAVKQQYSQSIHYLFFYWGAPHNQLGTNDATECGFMQDWKNCQWKFLHCLPS